MLSVFDIIITVLLAVAVLTVLIFAVRTKKFVKTLAVSCALGIGGLLVLYFTYPLSGFRLEITPYTLGASGIFGLPGVVCMAITKIIWFM